MDVYKACSLRKNTFYFVIYDAHDIVSVYLDADKDNVIHSNEWIGHSTGLPEFSGYLRQPPWWNNTILGQRSMSSLAWKFLTILMIVNANVYDDQPVDHVDRINSCSRTGNCAGTWPEHLWVYTWPMASTPLTRTSLSLRQRQMCKLCKHLGGCIGSLSEFSWDKWVFSFGHCFVLIMKMMIDFDYYYDHCDIIKWRWPCWRGLKRVLLQESVSLSTQSGGHLQIEDNQTTTREAMLRTSTLFFFKQFEGDW